MERTASHPANRRLLHGLTPETRRLLVEHLRTVEVASRDAWAASTLEAFDAAVEAANWPVDMIGADLAQRSRLVWLDSVRGPGRRGHTTMWALSAAGMEFLRDSRRAAREPLMGERAQVAALKVAA